MTAQQIREALRNQPFKPFVLDTTDGRQFPVRHPEFVAIFPGERSIFVGQDDERWDILDLLHVVTIQFGNGRTHRRRRGRRRD